jgi:hypothetical protein
MSQISSGYHNLEMHILKHNVPCVAVYFGSRVETFHIYLPNYMGFTFTTMRPQNKHYRHNARKKF